MAIIPKFTKNNRTLDPFTGWGRDFDSFFHNALQNFGYTPSELTPMTQDWAPTMDISETEEDFKVKLEMPGMDEKDIEITFQDNTLYVKGEKKMEKKEEKENYHRIESSYGSFMRTVPFATKIDEEKVAAEFKNGVLKVTLGKSQETMNKTRKIRIS
jgi:HSP20 family protein